MLEGLVANLLNRFLGMYVRNFDPKQLNVGIWSGDVKLRNLELRREALDQLRLPLNVVEGHLGQLTLQIPWSNLRGKPVKVTIEDLYLLAAPKEDAEYNAEDEEKRAHALKMEKLDSAELLKERTSDGMSPEEQKKNQSFTASLVTAIVDNLQVSIRNIHVRYEDSISDPGHPFAVGISLEELSAVSTDENWRPTFIQGTADSTHKLATLGALAVYWDTDASLLGTGKGSKAGTEESGVSHDEVIAKLKEMIVKSENSGEGNRQFILKPVSGRAGLEMDKTGKTDKPKMKARLLFDELGFVVDEDQYRDALMLVDLFHYFIRHQEYRKLQPKSRPKEDPRAWLRFAGQAVLDKIHDRNRRWSWEFFKERRDDRNRYMELFKKTKKEEKLSPPEAEELDKLEHKLTYQDLRFWRSLARNQLRKENVGVKKAPATQTWSSWVWSGGKKKADEHSDDSQMSEQQRKELYAAIDWDEKKAIAEAVEVPKDAVKLQVEMNLRTGGFTLKRDPHGKKTEILRLLFDSFSTKVLQRPESILAELSLDGMRLYDGTTENSLYPQIIKVKDAPPVPDEKRVQELDEDEKPKASEDDGDEDDHFFQMSFETNPLDGRADSALTVKLKGMEIVYNPTFVVEVAKFFKPPERHMESIGALMETAGATVEGFRKQTRAGLEYALQEHKTIDAHLDLQAPLIIIPDSVTEKSKICLILDAGHASVKSELIDKATIKDIQSKQNSKYTEEDYQQLQGLMYDKFILKLSSTQVLIGSSVEETRAQIDKNVSSPSLHIVDKINMDFTIETSIVPKASDLTKFRISGHLPVLHASMSDTKYKNLMKLIDVAIPKFDTEPGAAKSNAKTPSRPKLTAKQDQTDDLLGRERSKSFQLASKEPELDAEVDSDREREEDAKQKQPEVSINQRNFEFKFTVDKLQGSLYRSDPEGRKEDTLLVDLIAEAFYLEFYQRPFDMTAEVRLKSLAVEDHIDEDPIPEFRNIISSEDIFANSQKDLFQLKFVKVNSDSPEFESKYEKIATNLDVSVSTINLVVTRKTLLTLLDFVLITFTDSNPPPQRQNKQLPSEPKQQGEEEDSPSPAGEAAPSADKIRINADLSRISVILNNDGIRLATLSLNTATVNLLLAGKTMRIAARLGNLSLIDDVNQGASAESALRQLVTIQGEELADFVYETYDAETQSYPGYDMSIRLRSGSLKINFVTEPFRKIMDFAVKFGKMQAIFNAARQAAAQQASQIQERAPKIHFDVLIRTPIVVFPRLVVTDQPERDLLTAYLGEIYAVNEFVPLDESDKSSEVVNKLSAGIRHIRLTSLFHYDEEKSEELEVIDKVDINFNISYVEHKPGYERPDMEVQGSMSDINLKVTQDQVKFILELSRSIPAAFATEPEEVVEEEIEQELPDSTLQPARAVTDPKSKEKETDGDDDKKVASLQPELGSESDEWTKLDLIFKVGVIGFELLNGKPNEPIGDIDAASLSKFSLNETRVKLRMISDGSLEAELLIRSFTIRDSRTTEANKYRKIMSLINSDVKQQFMASLSMSGGSERNVIALVTIDSPRVILALDYLFALQNFANAAFSTDEAPAIEEDMSDGAPEEDGGDSIGDVETGADGQASADNKNAQDAGMSISFRLNIVDAQVILIANPSISNSEAIVLSTKQVLVSKQHVMVLQVDKVGMFLCRMDQFETTRLRILDDFSIQTSLETRSHGAESSITTITVDVEPLVLRLSLRDILLAMQVVSRASELSQVDESKPADLEPTKLKEIKDTSTSAKQKAASSKPKSVAVKKSSNKASQPRRSNVPGETGKRDESSVTLKKEEMKVQVHGVRVVLIGDLHELPMFDWSVKGFTVDVGDWSSSMTADTSIDTFLNVFNFSKSAWEPLIEPWTVGFHMSKDQHPDALSVELYSRKPMELTVTAATIALASKSFQFLSTDEDVLSKPRGIDAPYRIQNHTGFDMNVWVDNQNGEEGASARLSDGEEGPWRFEDPSTTRETLSAEGATGIVGIRLEGSGFDTISRIPVNREGEALYNLKPRKDNIQHRLLVEVRLGADNVKNVTFRSPLLVENRTQIPVEVGVFSPEEGHILKIEKIAPGDARPAPVGAAFMHSLIVRPDQGFGYAWSDERLFWRDLLKRRTRTVTCRGEQADQSPPFYFQLNAVFDKNDPLTRYASCVLIPYSTNFQKRLPVHAHQDICSY